MDDAAVELMRRIRAGDAGALDDLIARHGRILRSHIERYVPSADAQDLLQELWLRVWQRAHQWDGRGRLLAWLLTIATNLALNHLRARHPVVSLAAFGDDEFSETLATAPEALVPGPEDQAVWGDELDRARSALAQLPADKQAAVRLVRIEGRSLREAAAALGVPVGTIKSRLHHAHKLLMEQLEEDT
ncbi:MAG TPA: sigma-70 family RNA polymerase sigma factor [Armatimonadota bacterium]|nr:sigma-70 family RNA polymerase sigma factor [Armatimonadota bacterium]